jgi:hypothetical protein
MTENNNYLMIPNMLQITKRTLATGTLGSGGLNGNPESVDCALSSEHVNGSFRKCVIADVTKLIIFG